MRRRPASRWILGRDPRLGQPAKPTDDPLHREPGTPVGRVEHGSPHLAPRCGRHGRLPSPREGARLHTSGVEGMLRGSGNGRACRPRSGRVRVAYLRDETECTIPTASVRSNERGSRVSAPACEPTADESSSAGNGVTASIRSACAKWRRRMIRSNERHMPLASASLPGSTACDGLKYPSPTWQT